MAKLIFTGDWHFGRDNDSPRHNQYLQEFIEFMVDYANENDVAEIVQMGDYFDNRTKISNDTLNWGILGSKYISENFSGRYTVFPGNHDLYYKNRLDVAWTNALEKYAKVSKKVDERVIDGKTFLFVPWVCNNEEWDALASRVHTGEIDYVIGHFEFRDFYMNENYKMEHGLSHNELKRAKRVITGHYHKRQQMGNVIYVGSPFPFDYNDANDLERGFMVLDTDTDEVTFVDWGKVKILSLTYDEFLEYKEEGLIDEHTSVRIDLPDDADDALIEKASEEVAELPTNASKINYKGNKAKKLIESEVVVTEVDNIDETIIRAIRSIDDPPSDVNLDLLVEIFEQSVLETQDEYQA